MAKKRTGGVVVAPPIPIEKLLRKMESEYSKKVAEYDKLVEVLQNVRNSLERNNEESTLNGPITDTLWYSDTETLFDYIDAHLPEK